MTTLYGNNKSLVNVLSMVKKRKDEEGVGFSIYLECLVCFDQPNEVLRDLA
jgi:hypothetical protein